MRCREFVLERGVAMPRVREVRKGTTSSGTASSKTWE
jgi:hypothetical protein